MKDYFSEDSGSYARYRPRYPKELFDFLQTVIPDSKSAWDCGTGNGQIAYCLAEFMEEVKATDLSANQLKNARKKKNISYSCELAERSSFPDMYFDLITVGQAIHWFDFQAFYKEVNRVLKPGGVLAVIGYGLFTSNAETDSLIRDFYKNVVGPYWDPRRSYLEASYQTIPFPFEEIVHPDFKIEQTWSLGHLIGYLNTWSAVKQYQKKKGKNPLIDQEWKLKAAFGEKNAIQFPILLRLGRKKQSNP